MPVMNIEETERIASRSRLTEKDVKRIASRVDREMFKHFEEKLFEKHRKAGDR